MADKKPAAKPSKPSLEGQILGLAFVGVLVFLVVLPTVLTFFGYRGRFKLIPDNFQDRAWYAFTQFVDTVGFISIFITFVMILAIVYAKVRHKEITEEYNARLKAQDEIGKNPPLHSSLINPVGIGKVARDDKNPAFTPDGVALPGSEFPHVPLQVTNPKWIQIEKYMQSNSPAEWKVAILEADILLFDMLSQMGYEGDSIGEILKQVDKANFVTLDDAWKAHRIRNIIAHEGTDYELSREEAERTIRLFKRVFDEFYFI